MSHFETLKGLMADVQALDSAIALLDWDQQTYMPRGGAEARANHLEALSKMRHELFTSEAVQNAIANAQPESEDEQALVRVIRRDLDLATKLPTELVARKTKLSAVA
ncbi:MAG: carboxypeptidase M32, partial [Armatimonadota bacterium]